MRFIDEVRLRALAGDGGDGVVAWRREKFVPRGGPAGGDGGNGGDVVLVADGALSTLLDLRGRRELRAEHGKHGGNHDRHGRAGADLRLRIPLGTMVFATADADDADERLIGDLTDHGQELVVASGGRGGRGNIHFKSSTNRAPDRAEPGSPGEHVDLRLELKLLADVGIVGFPNVGKSTLISRISAARPKIADYPFTTLIPQLGVVALDAERGFVVADVPGLIRGASEGKGLGHTFLRHLERTRVLLHVIAPDPDPARAPVADLDSIEAELDRYGDAFRDRPRVVALNKVDTLTDDQGRALLQQTVAAFAARDIPLFPISAHTGEGVARLLDAVWRRLHPAVG